MEKWLKIWVRVCVVPITIVLSFCLGLAMYDWIVEDNPIGVACAIIGIACVWLWGVLFYFFKNE